MELYHYNHNHDPKTGKFTSGFFNTPSTLSNLKGIYRDTKDRRRDIKYLKTLDDSDKKIALYKKIHGDPESIRYVGEYYELKKHVDEFRPIAEEYKKSYSDFVSKRNEFGFGDYENDPKVKKIADKIIDEHINDSTKKQAIRDNLKKYSIIEIFDDEGLYREASSDYVEKYYPDVSDRYGKAYSKYLNKAQQITTDVFKKKGRDLEDLKIDLLNAKYPDSVKRGYETLDGVYDNIGDFVSQYYYFEK